MDLRDLREDLERWSARRDPVAIATLVAVRGSAPLPPGARFAVSGKGEVAGSISSGCVEGDLYERLCGVLDSGRACTVTYGITDEMALGVGLSCGGEIDVRLEVFDHEGPVWARLWTLLASGDPGMLVTTLSEPGADHLLLEVDGAVGSLGDGALNEAARSKGRELLGQTGVHVVELPGSGGATRVFMEPFARRPRLVVVGATPLGTALCDLASRVGFDVVAVDPRPIFLSPERFGPEIELDDRWPDEALADLDLDPRTSVVILTHDEKFDDPALSVALRSSAGYVGLLGGRKTQQRRRASLREMGFGDDDLARIHGPVGLDIGAKGPGQIAVSILAELVASGRAPST